MNTHTAKTISVLAAVIFAASCGGSDGPTGNTGVVQLVGMVTSPLSGECAGKNPISGAQALYTTTFQIHLVNTTADDVTITSISSTGQVVRATNAGDVGAVAHVFASLPFTPTPAVLAAKTGDLKVTATMIAGCGLIDVPTDFFRDIQTTVTVKTSAGEFAAQPVAIHVTWRAF